MTVPRPSLRQLEYILAIETHGSFSHGARACGVTQPALSTQIRRLEESLGVALFERVPTGAIATAAGERVIALARSVVTDVDEIVASAQSMQDPLCGTVRMGVIPTVAPYMLPQVMPSIRKRFPELRLLLREERTDRLTGLLGAGDLDIALVAVESDLGDLEVRPLFSDPFVLAVSGQHRLAGRKRVTPRDLTGEEVLLLDDGHCLRDQTLAICDTAGACELGDFRATSLSTLVHMVESGVGVTLLPAMAVETDIRLRRNLNLVPFASPVPARTVALAWRPSSQMGDHFEVLAGALASSERG